MLDNEVFSARCFAKVNLGLFIVDRLPNGYHDIETGFVFIDWSDRIWVRRHHQTVLECNDPDIPTGKDNLIIKAVQAFNRAYGLNGHYHIRLEKRIPAGAGLGGGSSNAAAMLKILEKINQTGSNDDELASLGAALGADVPVFVNSKTAIGKGTGISLEFANIQPDAWIVTVWPGIHSSTAQAYAGCEPFGEPPAPLSSILMDNPPDEWGYLLRNDLEPVVIGLYPEVGLMKDQMMDSGAVYAAMSGSGSAVFGIFDQELPALEIYKYLLDLGYKASITPPNFNPDQKVYRVENEPTDFRDI